VRPRDDAFGIGVWSRVPLVQTSVTEVAGVPMVRATVLAGDRRVRLNTAHVIAPVGADRDRWRQPLMWLDKAVRAEAGPLVVAGDLNATRWHRGLSKLLADAHERCGRGCAPT
jgi:endonuclease/exonuclease/phosphatase (EEP) superfamily protein YafD